MVNEFLIASNGLHLGFLWHEEALRTEVLYFRRAVVLTIQTTKLTTSIISLNVVNMNFDTKIFS